MRLHLRTLGGLSLVGEGLPTAAQQRRRLALLALLARAPGGRMSRDKLLALLWSESTESAARHALDQLLYATRRDLGRDAIRTADGQLRLDLEVVRVDCVEFERAIAAGELEGASHIYRGPFLDGFNLSDAPEFERWVDGERAALHARQVAVLEQLGTGALGRGDTAGAVEWRRQWTAANPYDTRAAVALIEALVAVGDRGGALRHLQLHTQRLETDLGVGADPVLVSRASEILTCSASPGVAEPARSVSVLPGASPEPVESLRDTVQAPPAEPPRERNASRSRRAVLMGVWAGSVLVASLLLLLLVQRSRDERRGAVARPAAAESAGDASAQRLYLAARLAWDERTRSGLERAVVLFRRSIALDPANAEAYAGLAQSYVLLGYHGYLAGDAAFPKGRAAAERALALDPECGEAYAALGMALQWEKRWAEAESAFERSVTLAPEHATAHQWFALLLTILGRNEEAVVHGRRAAELDPLSIQINNTYGIMLYNVAQLDSALRLYERIVTSEPDTAWVRQNPWVLDNFGKVSIAAGRYDEALELLSRAAHAVPGHPRPLYHIALVELARGDTAAARAAFAAADPQHAFYRMYRGLLEARLGDVESAFAWFDGVDEWGQPVLNVLVNDVELSALRRHPLYANLLLRLGLPEYVAEGRAKRMDLRKPRRVRGRRARDG